MMSEARHTDGPWQLESDDEGEYVVGSDGETIALLSNDVMDDGQREADARLILAAPELLKALTILAEAVEVDVSMFAGQPQKESALGLARSAIAKAIGQPTTGATP